MNPSHFIFPDRLELNIPDHMASDPQMINNQHLKQWQVGRLGFLSYIVEVPGAQIPWERPGKPWPDTPGRRPELWNSHISSWGVVAHQGSTEHTNNINGDDVWPSPLDRKVALASVMLGKCGLIRSSMVTVARELKADEMVLQEDRREKSQKCRIFSFDQHLPSYKQPCA